MTTIQVYRNRRNSNKYIEVHNDGHYHNSLKQYGEKGQQMEEYIDMLDEAYGQCDDLMSIIDEI